MRIHIVNPSDISFGTAVITPRWLYVLAAATPAHYGTPMIVDETLESFDPDDVEPGDVVGIGIHTGNALARVSTSGGWRASAGASVVFGGIHATLFPDEAREHGARARGRQRRRRPCLARRCWPIAPAGHAEPLYDGGRIEGELVLSARWDLLPARQLHVGIGADVRGCPKHCSFCSVWRTDGQKPRQRGVDDVVREVVALRRRGFRFILLADDNFYPVTLADLAAAGAGPTRASSHKLEGAPRGAIRADGAARAAARRHGVLHADHDGGGRGSRSSSTAMRQAHIRGALVGVESVTPEGLKAVYKNFNDAGEALVTRLQAFRPARRPRARLVHLRTADRHARHVRGDGRSRAARRRLVRAVRHADAVSRHGGLREMGAGRIGGTSRSDGDAAVPATG